MAPVLLLRSCSNPLTLAVNGKPSKTTKGLPVHTKTLVISKRGVRLREQITLWDFAPMCAANILFVLLKGLCSLRVYMERMCSSTKQHQVLNHVGLFKQTDIGIKTKIYFNWSRPSTPKSPSYFMLKEHETFILTLHPTV